MYQVGAQVMYGIHGVCQITELEEQTVDRKKILYYVLEPKDQPGAKYYVPTHNKVVVDKLRPIMGREELQRMLSSDEVRKDAWIQDENQRKQRYRELISSGDRKQLVCMVHTLHQHKKAQAAAGRKFHLCDENFLRDAEKLLSSELSLVLEIPQDQVGGYVRQAMGVE